MAATSLKYADFKGPAKPLDDIDLPKVASYIGCGEDIVHPLIDVETSGGAFDSEGRPKMLFEPHKFYAKLSGTARAKAVKQGLAYPHWGEHPYPKESYTRLFNAMAIDPTAALESCSWSLGQVMGEYYNDLGYTTVYDMVNAACEDAENGLYMMLSFIVAHHLDDDLRAIAKLTRPTTPADWAPVARVYNGSGYATNKYHIKLSASYNKWRGIPDTIWSAPVANEQIQAAAAEIQDPVPALPPVSTRPTPIVGAENIRMLQQALRDKGYIEVGKADGVMGKNTLSAIAAFEIANNMPVTAQYSVELLNAVNAAPMRPVSEERANATADTLVKEGKDTIKPALLLRNVGTALAATSGLGAIFDGGSVDLDHVINSATKFHAIYVMLGNVAPWLIGLAVSGVVIYFAHDLISKQVKEYRKGTLR